MSAKIRENIVCWKKIIFGILLCTCQNGKYLGSIIDDLAITYDEIKQVTRTVQTKTTPTKTIPAKTIPTNFN